LDRYFFDSSAIAKRYHPEAGSSEVERLFAEPGREIRISRLSFVETQSVCAMKVRSGFLTVEEVEMQRERLLADIASGEIEVRSVTADHFSSAERLIARHGYKHRLRTLDALQLAVAVELLSEGLLDKFVVADKVLAEVAALEGFFVLNSETL
jgi:predicted nucleic acid-binding protein